MRDMCNVCGTAGEVFVHSSSVGPMSFASCRECLNHHAEPAFAFDYLHDYVSTDGEGLAEWVNDLSTHVDGKYMTWAEWLAWRQHPDRKATLDAKRDADLREIKP